MDTIYSAILMNLSEFCNLLDHNSKVAYNFIHLNKG